MRILPTGRPCSNDIVAAKQPVDLAAISAPAAAHVVASCPVTASRPAELASIDNVTKWLYHLSLSRPLPTVKLANTLAQRSLPASSLERYLRVLRAHYWVQTLCIRLSGASFAVLLFVDSVYFHPVALGLSAGAFVGFSNLVLLSSLDILALLTKSYEFWFMSALNLVNWLTLALIFRDARALVSLTCWLGIQNVITIDANYRSFKVATKSIVLSIPSMIVLAGASSYQLIGNANFFSVPVFHFALQAEHVIMYASSTLSVFMLRKAYLKRTRLTTTVEGLHTIPCVSLKARLRLTRVHPDRARRLGVAVNAIAASQLSQRETTETATGPADGLVGQPSRPDTQRLHRSRYEETVVDARLMLTPASVALRLVYSRCIASAIFAVGCIGLVLTTCATVYPSQGTSETALLRSVRVGALMCSALFLLANVCLAQRDLVLLLLRNFDFVFSSAQFVALAVCLCDLLRWEPGPCLTVSAWTCWFHWVIVLDAVTPPIKAQLGIRRRHAALTTLVILIVLAAAAAELLLDRGGGAMFVDRVIWSVPLSNGHAFEQSTREFALQRIVTILGWNIRLFLELAMQGDGSEELLFIQGLVEYTSAFDTFPAQASTPHVAPAPSE